METGFRPNVCSIISSIVLKGLCILHSFLLESRADLGAPVTEASVQKSACPARRERPWTGRRGRNQLKERRRRRQRKELEEKGEEHKTKALQIYSKLQEGNEAPEPSKPRSCSRFEDCEYLTPPTFHSELTKFAFWVGYSFKGTTPFVFPHN